MRRPALKTALPFCAGIVFGYFAKIPLLWLSFLLLGLLVVYFIINFTRESNKILNLLLIIIVVITGVFWYCLRTTLFPEDHIQNYIIQGEEIALTGSIVKDPDLRIDETVLECAAETLLTIQDVYPVTGKVLIYLKYPTSEFQYGDLIEVYGKLGCPSFPRNPETFDYGTWLKRKEIFGVINVWNPEDIAIIGKGVKNPFISQIALPIKRFIRGTIDRHLDGETAGFLKAVVIRERGMLSKEVKVHFQNTGTIHVLAVSGLHIAIIALILFSFLRLFRLPLIVIQIITTLLLLLYPFLVDLRVPVIRATVIVIVGMVALTTERDIDMLNVLAGAALLILFVNPRALFDTSFQFSFIAVASIIYLYPIMYPLLFGRLKTKYRVTQLFTLSLCAQLGLIPLTAHYFFKVPLISIIANIFVIPLTGFCIALTFLMSLFNLLPWGVIASIFAGAIFGVTTLTLKIVELFNNVPYAYFWVNRPSLLFILFYYLILLSFLNFHISDIAKKVFVYSIIIGLSVIVWSRVYKITHPEVKITCLDVGHGDCVFIELPSNYRILIDGGPTKGEFDAGKSIIAPFLRAKGISTLDLVIASSPKTYRIGGLSYIIENFKVKKFIASQISYRSWKWLQLLEYINWKDIPCRFVVKGDRFLNFEVLNPSKEDLKQLEDIDENSLALHFKYGKVSFLFPGDVGKINYPRTTVALVPKHGNKNCSSLEYIATTVPKIAIVQCGRNSWGEPDSNLLTHYQSAGVKVFRADKEGAATMTITNKGVELVTMKSLSKYESMRHRVFRYIGLLQ